MIAERVQSGSETVDEELGIDVSWRTRWTTLECYGCETVCLRRAHWFSEWDDGSGRGGEQVEFFPPLSARHPPRWLDQLANEEQELVREVYVALQADSRRLAMMGARAVVDIVMNRDGDQGSFGAGLDALEARGLIGRRQRQVLEAALDVGHAAAHRGHRPTGRDVDTVIDIVEHLLQAELLGPAADDLRTRTPPRPPRVGRPRRRNAGQPSPASTRQDEAADGATS